MRVINSLLSTQKILQEKKRQGKSIGLVPTMGALHEGHLSLLRKARRENDIVILSIFVNPKQFAPNEDFTKYPRPAKKDIFLAKKEKVDIILYPSEKKVYPTGFLTYVEVDEISSTLCGKNRPGHFRGVTTVVAKLLNIVQPNTLYLGQKDAQQAIVLKTMVHDLNMPVKVRVCPIIREKDGLALSSRNAYLSTKHRQEAITLYQALKKAKTSVLAKKTNAKQTEHMIQSDIRKKTSGTIDYISCVDAETLRPLKTFKGKVMIALAIKFGKTRLIDNIIFNTK